jgi:hypothetical protein
MNCTHPESLQAINCKPSFRLYFQTPKHKRAESQVVMSVDLGPVDEVVARRSPRLKQKGSSDKAVSKMAHDLLAKKYGILANEETLDRLTL